MHVSTKTTSPALLLRTAQTDKFKLQGNVWDKYFCLGVAEVWPSQERQNNITMIYFISVMAT